MEREDLHRDNEMAELRQQLHEAMETLHAIRTGQVDAIVVEHEEGHQLYTLKSADQTYRFFIEKMKEGAVTIDEDCLVLYCNSQFAKMVNLSLSDVIGRPFHSFISKKYHSFFDQLMNSAWDADSRGEIPFVTADGEVKPFLLSITFLKMDEGSALSIILTDLSDQKKAEQELKEKNKLLEEARLITARMNEELEKQVKQRTHDLLLSREHFKFLADNIPVVVWTTDAEGTINYLNQKWLDYAKNTTTNSTSSFANGIVHPDDYGALQAAWEKAKKDRTHFNHEFRMKRISDGSYRWHQATAEPFFDNQKKLSGWFGTTTDIEDQRKALERKDEFIGVASHELKTPLTSLKGYIQLIEQQHDGSENLKKYLTKANHSLDKLQHLINDLLDVSKIQAGKLEFSREKVNLTEVLNNCIENAEHIYPEFTIKKDIDAGLMIIGNAERIEQVLMNLISNAVKYSPVNKIIEVSAHKLDGHAEISVKDRGIGLTNADQKKIFDRFYRVEDNKYMASGLGMGLYISSEIIREHKGTVSVKSVLGEGSIFSFTLPLLT